MADVTHILSQINSGDPAAAEQLLPLVYVELRKLAAVRLAQEKPGHTLQPTALVHEAYLKLVDVQRAQHWDSRGHFFAAAAEAMRRVAVRQAALLRRNDESLPINLIWSVPDQLIVPPLPSKRRTRRKVCAPGQNRHRFKSDHSDWGNKSCPTSLILLDR